MQPDPVHGAATLDKAMALLLAMLPPSGATLSQLAERAGIAPSTARRLAGALLRQGLLSRTGPGQYAAGLRLAELARLADRQAVLAGASRTLLRQLARRLATTVHLGVLDGDMVTYLVKEHGGGPRLRTSEGHQLEAYCSAIGKVLLAALDERARARYLAAFPFVPLTRHTITDAATLHAALRLAAATGHATDRAEFEDGLYCLAVPVRGPGGDVVAALSASSDADHGDDPRWLEELRHCAVRVGGRLGSR